MLAVIDATTPRHHERGQGLRSGLAQGEVHVWTSSTARCMAVDGFRRFAHGLMPPDEAQRWSRFRFERDRDLYLVSRALLRTTLSRYADLAPRDWCFLPEAHGKPRIANEDASAQRLAFNLSHADGMAVVAVARGRELGIDVECTAGPPPFEVTDQCFTPAEAEALHAQRGPRREAKFWSLWTLKESYLKATGLGLSASLQGFSVVENEDGRTRLSFVAGAPGSDDDWELMQWNASPAHVIALCAQRVEGASLAAYAFETIPLHEAHGSDTPTFAMHRSL